MGLSVREQVGYWSVGLLVFGLILWSVSSSLLPFIAGAAIAYLLDPTADKLESWGMSRVWATVVITVGIIAVLLAIPLLLSPLLVNQIQLMIENGPAFVASARDLLIARFPDLLDPESGLGTALASATARLQEQGPALLNQVLTSGLAIVDFLLVLVIAPIIAFYMLMDWDRMIASIDNMLPREHAPEIRLIFSRIDEVLAGFVRGQLTVCAILGAFYAIALSLVGLQFGLVIGMFAGLISFIPFVGSILGGGISIAVALIQFWGDWPMIIIVAAIFLVGQGVEGNVLTPNLVGNSVQLHPVWLIFALSAFGSLMGFTGLLIAVPLAATIGVMVRWGVEKYTSGRLYLGPGDDKT